MHQPCSRASAVSRHVSLPFVPITFLFIFIYLFWWGKEGKCIMHRDARAPCMGLQYGLPLGTTARWTICRLTHPLKPFPAGWLGYIPLRKLIVGYGLASRSTKLPSPQRDRRLRWRIVLLVGSMNFVAIQLFLIRFDIISFSISIVSFGTTS